MKKASQPLRGSRVPLRIAQLKQELAEVSRQCETATLESKPGQLFFLLRKKWMLSQHVFQAESEWQITSRNRRQEGRRPAR
jgi:hypothetical protein